MTIKINPCESYNDMQARYKRVRDLVNGEYKLKEVDLEQISQIARPTNNNLVTTNYLRYINPTDRSEYNKQRNIGFINGARLFNATSRTLSGLMGMLFRVYPTKPEFASAMDYLFEDVDGAGLSMNQQAQNVAWNVTQIGRHGLLTDMPRNEDGHEVTRADVDNGFRPTIQQYTAENIIDWNESVVQGAKILDLLVLREESYSFCNDRISREKTEIMRVYRLTDNVVTVQIYTKEKDGGFIESAEVNVVTSNQQSINRIPFSFVGSVNNSPTPDLLPLEPLTDVNLGHYQESANLRSSSYQLSAAQPVISDDNYANYARNPKEDGVVDTGEDSIIILGTGGSFAFHSPSPNSISADLMANDEERMVALGAQLVMSGGQAETAEAARIKRSSDVSTLESIAMNISIAYTKQIEYAYQLMGVIWNEPVYMINREFFDTSLSAEDAVKLVAVWQSGAISKDVLDTRLQSGKVIGEGVNLEDMNDTIEEEQGSGGGVDFEEGEESKLPTATTEE